VTGHERAELAREYLASVRQHKVTELPPSVLVRECAELRRQLGQVLDAIGQPAGPGTTYPEPGAQPTGPDGTYPRPDVPPAGSGPAPAGPGTPPA